ncbi:hypothetical protein BS78_01G214500 [Paspalum vaginatum]|nr:hypothetical protein BS78_01G214500 [Paspalum vaginatum]
MQWCLVVDGYPSFRLLCTTLRTSRAYKGLHQKQQRCREYSEQRLQLPATVCINCVSGRSREDPSSMASLHTSGSGRSAAVVKQLLWRLRCTWRSRATQPRRPAVTSFGYDLHNYSQNFDDGLASSGHHRL